MTRSATGTSTTSPTPERLQALTRDDKWFLSCGDGIIWAPPFPRWLHHPGFWDEALVYYHAFAPLFSVALVDSDGDEISLGQHSRRWRPDRISTAWVSPNDARLVEERYALPGGRFVSDWSYQHSWVLDLLVRGVAGVVPTHDAVIIDPLPLEPADVALTGVTIRDRSVSLNRQGDTTSIQLDGASYETALGSPLEIPL